MNNKLVLREKMIESYLIQRLKKPVEFKMDGLLHNPFAFGGGYKNGGFSDGAMKILTKIFSFDYMGAAEFEFGALPNTFGFLQEQAINKNLQSNILQINKDKIYIIYPKPYMEEVIKRVSLLAKSEYNKGFCLKEYCGLKDALERKKLNDEDSKNNTLGWVEIINGFMFFIDENMFKKTCNLFEVET